MVNLRKAILKRLKRLGKTRNWLAEQTGLRTATIYGYLKDDGADIRASKVEKMLDALRMDVQGKD